jgi:transcriptional regulator with XRE-family HTH domain
MTTTFGGELRRLMTGRGVSTRRLADLVPCNHGYVSKLAQGVKHPSPEMAARMDDVLDAGGALVEASRSTQTPDVAMRRLQSLMPAQTEELLGHLQDQWHALVALDETVFPGHRPVYGVLARTYPRIPRSLPQDHPGPIRWRNAWRNSASAQVRAGTLANTRAWQGRSRLGTAGRRAAGLGVVSGAVPFGSRPVRLSG